MSWDQLFSRFNIFLKKSYTLFLFKNEGNTELKRYLVRKYKYTWNKLGFEACYADFT